MTCLLCNGITFSLICKKCQNTLLKPTIKKQQILPNFYVYSFYNYDEIKELINSKYHFYGDRVYNILANICLKTFATNITQECNVLNIADNKIKDYSQSAILAHALKTKYITPKYNKIVAQNRVKYAGKSLDFRLNNPRDFKYFGKKGIKAILVDDVITTGQTLKEAKSVLEKHDCIVLFGVTLAYLEK
jgi:competence protein ComFC